MKKYQMVVFFLSVFIIYFGANIYIYFKGSSLFAATGHSSAYLISFIILSSLFIAGKMLERNNSGIISDILNIAGGFWLAYMLYAFLLYLVSDAGLLLVRWFGSFSDEELISIRRWRFILVNAVTVILVVAGFINALTPVIKEYEVSIAKSVPDRAQMKLVAVSDIHLGSTIRKRSMRKLQSMISTIKPDMVLFLGDIVDGEIGPVLRDDLLASFSCPPCMEGVYAITGNHEYIGGIEKTSVYIRSKGLNLLEDETVKTPSGIILVGRKDRDSFRYTGNPRASLEELLGATDRSSPIIVMDHQPYDPRESASIGADIHLSGHTHNGQMWPLSLLVSRIYEFHYGFSRIGSTNVIVSSGYGLWGPRVRIGSRSEIISINIKFTGASQSTS
ncbi:MAG: metallophosphoesterase [Bacteroidales bacterium]|nr:metallophosphoesterase [Bacteroidales bacterium]